MTFPAIGYNLIIQEVDYFEKSTIPFSGRAQAIGL
jgi:hypothetical protein